MVDPSYVGKVFPSFDYRVERGKVREFLLAIGDDHPGYRSDDPPLPPTFPTAFMFWGGFGLKDVLKEFGIEIRNVLHAEQEYEYLAPIHIGDTVTGQMRISDIYVREGRSGRLEFIELLTEYTNQNGDLVLKERGLIIVRS